MSRSRIEIRGDKLWGKLAIDITCEREEDELRLDEIEGELFRFFRALFLFRGQQYVSGGFLFIYLLTALPFWMLITWLVMLVGHINIAYPNMITTIVLMIIAFSASSVTMLLVGLSWYTGRCFDIYFRHTIPSLISRWEDVGDYTYSHSGLTYEEGTASIPYSYTTYTDTHRVVTSGTDVVVNKQQYYKEITLTAHTAVVSVH